jgi:glycosyltransferase involved in cell wall biosynthesis
MNELISVVIPTYNRFDYLVNAIESVIKQTYRPIQIIVVNDNSKHDRYYQYDFQEMLNNIKDIKLIVHHCKISSKEKLGYSCGSVPRNIGISLSTGKYIAFLDDDDIWLPNKLSIQINQMILQNINFSCTDGYIGSGFYEPTIKYPIYNKEYYWETLKNKLNLEKTFPSKLDLDIIYKHNIIITSSVVLTKKLVDIIGEMENIPNGGKTINGKKDWQDWNYWRKCLKKEKYCLYLQAPLFYYDLK